MTELTTLLRLRPLYRRFPTMRYRLLCVLWISIISAPAAVSGEAIDAGSGKTPAAMVWQVQSKDRLIFLAGELHRFEGIREADIDFQFGLDLYNYAADVYTEAKKNLALSTPPPEKLSALIGPELWQRIETVVSTNVPLVMRPPERATEFRKQLLQEMDSQTAVMAEINLRLLSYFAHVARTMQRPSVVTGLMTMLWKLDEAKGADAKIKTLEGVNVADEIWRRDCNTRELAQKMMESALMMFDDDTFWNTEKPQASQKVFTQKGATGDAILATWLASYPGSRIQLSCNVLPRNAIWLEKISVMLRTPGPPVMINVGAIHLFGDKGLLAQLSNSDGLVIHRIYSLKNK